jgi:transposase
MSHATVSDLPLTAADHSFLSTLAQARTAPRHHAERAGIVLQLATGRSVREAATRLSLHPQRVRRCARRAAAVGAIRALDDLPRSGRPRQITQAARLWLVGQACAQPKNLGYPHELWTLRLLAGHARRLGPAAGHPCLATLVPSTVRTILQEQEVRPHKVRYYLERRDPAFDERLAAVVEVYRAAHQLQDVAPEGHRVAILSYDEKPGLQALAPTAPDRPPQPGRHPTVQRDHEYKRLGTVTLSAAVDLVSGVVHHALTQRHRSCEFVTFLRRLDASYPAEWRIRLLLDNHSAHRSRETRRFLDSCSGRFELVFTPKHASWLNYVETFFSKMARSVLRHIRVASRQELCERITAFIHACNDAPVAPKWSYGLDTSDACVAT